MLLRLARGLIPSASPAPVRTALVAESGALLVTESGLFLILE